MEQGKLKELSKNIDLFAKEVGKDVKELREDLIAIIDDTTSSYDSTYSSTKIDAELDKKVDKELGKGLSDENFTTAEKNKLATIEGSKFKGLYYTLAQLQTAHPTGEAGWYADVDQGAETDVVRYIWDVSDAKWIPQQSGTPITGAQIKQMYEEQPDTNAFTDDDKAKVHSHSNKTVLDGITEQKVTNWDDANSKKHTHDNKSTLDGITEQKVTNWDNADDFARNKGVPFTGATKDINLGEKHIAAQKHITNPVFASPSRAQNLFVSMSSNRFLIFKLSQKIFDVTTRMAIDMTFRENLTGLNVGKISIGLRHGGDISAIVSDSELSNITYYEDEDTGYIAVELRANNAAVDIKIVNDIYFSEILRASSLNLSDKINVTPAQIEVTATEEWVTSQIPTIPTDDIAKGVTAYGWGYHADAGYAKEEDIPTVPSKATQEQNEAGEVDNVYTTPLGVSQYVDAQIDEEYIDPFTAYTNALT